MPPPDLLAGVLLAAFGNGLVAPDAETGIAELAACVNRAASPADWQATVAKAVADGLIYDPVRLLPGALQCHWRLELTPEGFAEAARLHAARSGSADTQKT